ncbi:MAG: cytochrome C oxidase assembly protein, partial [Acidithiobacillus sp.]
MSSVLSNHPAAAPVEAPPHAVEPEMTPLVRRIGKGISAALLAAMVAGLWRGLESSGGPLDAMVAGLGVTEVGLAMVLILLGSLVEGFGYGLSLGTKWPYTRNIALLMLRGDPEA